MYQEREFESPFSAGDALFNSGMGMAANFATDFFADNIIETEFRKAARLGDDLRPDTKDIGTLSPNSRNAQSDYQKYMKRSSFEQTVDTHIKGQTDGRGYSKGKHHTRSALNNSTLLNYEFNTFDKKWSLGKFIYDPDKKARLIGLRQAAGSMVNDPNAPTALKDSLKKAISARGFGIAAMSIGFAQVGFELGKAGTNALASKGRNARFNTRGPEMSGGGFQDTRGAYTGRQQAMRAIQLSQSGMRRSLGNEAEFLASHR